MVNRFSSRAKLYIWQILFLSIGSGWLLGPIVNTGLSAHTTLISEYENTLQPYSWLFRLTDVISALLFIAAIIYIHHKKIAKLGALYPLFLLLGIFMFIDPLATITCVIRHGQCIETRGISFYIHAAESTLTAVFILGFSLYDTIKRKLLASTTFLGFQIVYGAISLLRLPDYYGVNTLTQYIYQLASLVWLTWYVVSLVPSSKHYSARISRYVRRAFGVWAYFNGMLAILTSLLHIHVVKLLQNIYFGNNTAWLAQHGVIVGVGMLYVSRHLWRGEYRARQVFLALLSMQVIKYAIISPEFWLLQLYSITFAVLFASKPHFRRGSAQQPWMDRLQEIIAVLSGVLISLSGMAIIVKHSRRYSQFAQNSLRRIAREPFTHAVHRSTLLTHTLTSLIIATGAFIIWSLFRPTPLPSDDQDYGAAQKVLNRFAQSSEDFFKYWPHDKIYYWSADRNTLIAYRTAKSVVFMLADPVGPSSNDQKALLKDFLAEWSARGFVVCSVLIPESSLQLYSELGLNPLRIGSSAIVNINQFTTKTIGDKWWRWQLNRAKKAGYQYGYSKPPHDDALLAQISEVSDNWLTRHGHREQGFAMGSYSTAYMQQSVLHYLREGSGKVVAFTNELTIYNDLPQTTVDLMRFRPEYHNTMPPLLAYMISQLAKTGQYKTFDLGFAPLADMQSVGAKLTKLITSSRFSAAGLEQFKNKFDPHWQKNYIAYAGDLTDLAAIALALEEAMKP